VAIQLAKVDGLRVIADAAVSGENLVPTLGADQVVARGPDVGQRIRQWWPDGVAAVVDGSLQGPAVVPAIRDGVQMAVVRGWEPHGSSGLGEDRGITVRHVFVPEYTHRSDKLDELRALTEEGMLTLRVARTYGRRSGRGAPRVGGRRGSWPTRPDLRLTTQGAAMTTPLPESAHVSEAVAHLRNVLHPQIYNHSVRTFLLGRQAALRDGVADLDSESLCLAALFRDSGTAASTTARLGSRSRVQTPRRQRGCSATVIDLICEAIALHTTPGIPERRGPIAHYLRRGVEVEFGPAELRTSFEDGVVDAESRYPRTDLEEILQTLVVEQALRQPQ
jgi:hypothetical protein